MAVAPGAGKTRGERMMIRIAATIAMTVLLAAVTCSLALG